MKIKLWTAKIILSYWFTSVVYALPSMNICPDAETIRVKGSACYRTYSANNQWILVSNEFTFAFYHWQTFYRTNMNTSDNSSDNALLTGNQLFKNLSLLTEPSFVITNDKIQCSYAPVGADYRVYTVTPLKVSKF